MNLEYGDELLIISSIYRKTKNKNYKVENVKMKITALQIEP